MTFAEHAFPNTFLDLQSKLPNHNFTLTNSNADLSLSFLLILLELFRVKYEKSILNTNL